MKIPAIRAKMGDWTYYISTLTFKQVSDYVSRVDEELHRSQSLQDLIQRSITNNYKSIKEYILNQPERFFNALILAVYNEYPDWQAIEMRIDDFESHQIGILEFPGTHKIFPLDGQHRVEGIKAAIESNPSLASEIISVIFVGHKNDEEGMRRSRRLFSTLNRYAKPVTMDDIIALDEDDSIAIVTRSLLEDFELFLGKRVTKSRDKSIHDNDKSAITSIITLYQCNKELLKLYRAKRKRTAPNRERDKKSLNEYLKFRPNEQEIELYQNFCFRFWSSFQENIDAIREYSQNAGSRPAEGFRLRETGGHLLFRPVGLLPFVQACCEIHNRKGHSFVTMHRRFNRIDFSLASAPWRSVTWNPIEKTMIMGSTFIVKLLLFYMYNRDVIRQSELQKLKEKYAAKLNRDVIDDVLHNVTLID